VQEGPLAVVGGSCGGAGASTLAASLALAAAKASSVLLVDADPWGGGLDLVLGAERCEGLRWPDLLQLHGRVSGEALLAALPEVGGVSVLAAGRGSVADLPEEALVAAVEAARGEGWPVVVDVPRPGAGGAARAVEVVLAAADLPALVVPARVRAVWAARLLTAGDGPWSGASLVVRPLPGGLSVAEVAELVGRPVLAELRHDRAALARGERGEPPLLSGRAAFGTAARRLLTELTGQPSQQRAAS
jgi:secretion/DNA translocation related CpaE-like protein